MNGMPGALLQVKNLSKDFPISSGFLNRTIGKVHAVENVSFNVDSCEVVGLVGESGSGKTTLGRSILRLLEPSEGEVIFNGQDITKLRVKQMQAVRREMQIIFQDPFSSLNGRLTVKQIVGEALAVHGIGSLKQRPEMIATLLKRVGLASEHMSRYPHEFSGGQRQRIGIARALAVSPRFIVADEPVSALDVSVQAQVLNLLQDLQKEMRLAVLFISHDLMVVEHICDRVIVLYLGRIMEIAPSRSLYLNPKHPYTEALLSAAPVADHSQRKQRIILKGDLPSPIDPPSGCVFRTRCPYAVDECARLVPPLREVAPDHFKACIRDVL